MRRGRSLNLNNGRCEDNMALMHDFVYSVEEFIRDRENIFGEVDAALGINGDVSMDGLDAVISSIDGSESLTSAYWDLLNYYPSTDKFLEEFTEYKRYGYGDDSISEMKLEDKQMTQIMSEIRGRYQEHSNDALVNFMGTFLSFLNIPNRQYEKEG